MAYIFSTFAQICLGPLLSFLNSTVIASIVDAAITAAFVAAATAAIETTEMTFYTEQKRL